MPGLGTIVNVLAIVVGGSLGLGFGKIFTAKLQESLMTICGVMTIFIGAGGTLSKMLVIEEGMITTTGTMMMIMSLLIGTILGELVDLDDKMALFGEWMKRKTGNQGDSSFTGAFVTASLTVCIGAMAVVGAMEDGIYANHSILYTKAILDLIIIAAMAVSLGKGAVFSAVSVGIFQGILTLLARVIAPVVTDAAMFNLSYVGNILIFCVGLNLLWPGKVKVANMLPALVVALVWSFLPFGL